MFIALGRRDALRVMKSIKYKWKKASVVAGELDIHIVTTIRCLNDISEVGLAEKRFGKSWKTRRYNEYKLKTPNIKIEFNLDEIGCE